MKQREVPPESGPVICLGKAIVDLIELTSDFKTGVQYAQRLDGSLALHR